MRIVALCPTYGRPSLVRNALGLFLRQQVSHGDTAHLLIYSDDGLIPSQHGSFGCLTWEVMGTDEWQPLTEKYNPMVEHARSQGIVDGWSVWDDDDIYLPWHLYAHMRTLEEHKWSHPTRAWSTCGINPLRDPPKPQALGGRRYHGALAVRDDLMRELNGYPRYKYNECNYDKEMLSACRKACGVAGDPCKYAEPSYVYRWRDTGRDHCSARARNGILTQPRKQEEPIEELTPQFDNSTMAIFANFKC